jgi:hypothetical protein
LWIWLRWAGSIVAGGGGSSSDCCGGCIVCCRCGETLLRLRWAASAALAVRRLLVGHGWWVRRLLDIGIN